MSQVHSADSGRVTLIVGPLNARVDGIPGSKSIANRVLVCAALAEGTSELAGVPDGDDTEAFVDCVAHLGARLSRDLVAVDLLKITGTGGLIQSDGSALFARLAGTTSRFITALAALGTTPTMIDGAPPLRARPMAPLHDALRSLGAEVSAGETWGHLPVTVARRDLSGGTVDMPGDVSSQYITALMLIAPYLTGGLMINLTSPLVSRPYVDITRSVMADFGVSQVEVTNTSVHVHEGRYGARPYRIEPDASSASYPLAAAAVCGGRVTIVGLCDTSVQGDAAFADVLGRMGCTVQRTATSTTVERSGELHGVTVDMADISDTAPTLAAIAAFADSPTRITGIGFIRAKESDRIGDLVRELRRCGIAATEEADGLLIEPSQPVGARVETYHDHRLAMSLALIGLRVPGVEIADPGVVSKSWPGFWGALRGLATPAH
jgi:3-phosphoshikimate 1-carboxyvinyltransferase